MPVTVAVSVGECGRGGREREAKSNEAVESERSETVHAVLLLWRHRGEARGFECGHASTAGNETQP
jgi:hypothetical protein